MDDRKQLILRAIIREYIGKIEPVSSKNITNKYGLDVSSATVRNEMSHLEKLGYIEQPHTSAGRIPSELGYRYYVDYLMEKYRIALSEKKAIDNQLDERVDKLDSLLERAGKILSELTSYPSIVSEPNFTQKKYRHVKLVGIDEKLALLVIVLEDGEIKNYQVNVVGHMEDEDYLHISKVLNEHLKGKEVNELSGDLVDKLAFQSVADKLILEDVLHALTEVATNNNVKNIHISGTLNIFNQPEFKDVEKVRDLLGFFEQQKALQRLIEGGPEGIRIKIGEEVPLDNLEGLSVITSTYCINGKPVGTIGVIGPTRMTYSKSSTLLEKVAEGLSVSLIRLLR